MTCYCFSKTIYIRVGRNFIQRYLLSQARAHFFSVSPSRVTTRVGAYVFMNSRQQYRTCIGNCSNITRYNSTKIIIVHFPCETSIRASLLR